MRKQLQNNKTHLAVMKTILLLIFSILSTVSTFAQEENSYQQLIQPQASYIFDSYNPNEVDADAEKEKIEAFVKRIKETSRYTKGHIFIYRGASDYKFDADKRRELIYKALTPILENNSLDSSAAYARFAGFRQESTVEMIIAPSVRENIKATLTESLLNIKYYDDSTLPKGTVQKTWNELISLFTNKVEPKTPPAARAVRAVGEVVVLIKIDEKGNVVETEAFIGHPLLRLACTQSLKESKFEPQTENDSPVKVVGLAVCNFDYEEPTLYY